MKKIAPICMILSVFFTFSNAQEYEIAPWLNDKTAAIIITFDDNLDGQFSHAQPIMDERGIKGTFYVITGSVDWTKASTAAAAGHEIGSHSVTHANLANIPEADAIAEVQNSYNHIVTNIPEQDAITIAWPFGSTTLAASDEAKKHYVGARGVNAGGGVMPYIGAGSFGSSGYIMHAGVSTSDFQGFVDQAISYGGFFMCLYHGIETGGYNNISASAFEAHMDAIAARDSLVWATTFSNMRRYYSERACATLLQTAQTDSTISLYLSDTLSNNAIYDHPLSVKLKIAENIIINSVTQNGNSISFNQLNDTTVLFNAVPDGGAIELKTEERNMPPAVDGINSYNFVYQSGAKILDFTLTDEETPANELILSAVSSNQSLLPTDSLRFTGENQQRGLVLSPLPGETGNTNITLTASDGVKQTQIEFLLEVIATENETPTISDIANQTTYINQALENIAIEIDDRETDPRLLRLSATSNNESLIAPENIVLSGQAENRTLSITPENGQSGTANITIAVDDGTQQSSVSFEVEVVDNTSLEELAAQNQFKIFPNPVQNQLFVEIKAPLGGHVAVEIFSLAGKSLFTERFSQNSQQIEIRTEFLPQGTYILTISGKNFSASRKFVRKQ